MAKPKLTELQRLAVLDWIADGLTTNEMNNLGANFTPPFKISPQLNYQYRKDYDIDLQKLRNEKDALAISTGLAVRGNRIQQLIKLALLLEEDIHSKGLTWVDSKTDKNFNEPELRQLRGIYDDIAKETGGRIQRTDVTSGNKQIKGYVLVSPEDWPDKPE